MLDNPNALVYYSLSALMHSKGGLSRMHFDSNRPIWLQVMGDLEISIVTGRRQPGEKLPGGRDLAQAYGINPNTAVRVYQELEKGGLCETRRGLGTFVTEDAARIATLRTELARQAVQDFTNRLSTLGVSREEAARMILEEEENHA